MSQIKNAMTVDVEDYFHVSAFEKQISPNHWDTMECRVPRNMKVLFDLFEQHDAKATFFVLGWVAKKYPQLIKEIVDRGHELASHGMNHRRATEQTDAVFREDVETSKKLLEDLSGQKIVGYRAPSFSFNKTNPWVYDVLTDLGFQYSSSVYPVKHDLYGVPDAPRTSYSISDALTEIPLSTYQMGSRNIPISGGGFFRLYPYFITKHGIRTLNEREKMPYIFYMHPWEVDPGQPRVAGASFKSRFRHYLNLSRVESRMKRMLSDFQWTTMTEAFQLQQPA